MQHVIGINSN
jgi:hypothetical protein